MLSNEAKKQFKAHIQGLGKQIRQLNTDHRDEARELYSNMKLDDAIKLCSPLEYQSKRILDLASEDSTFGPVFGLDGGSTRPKVLENGTMLCAVQAVMSGDGEQKFDGLPIEAFRSLSLVSHSHRVDLGGAKSELLAEDPYAHLWRVHISKTYLDQDIDRVVPGIARAAAESYHAQRLVSELDLDSGLFFLDGNLYPIGLYYYFARGSSASRFESTNWTEWKPAMEILAQPLKAVESFAERGWPCVAINKNPGTSWLLEFTLPEASHNWSNDAQFIKAVLSKTGNDELGYTNWFVQERYSLPQAKQDEERATFDLFERLKLFGLQHEPASYHTCFFYIYDPRVLSVLKIEVPRMILDSHGAEALRKVILAEIAKGKGVPNAIRRADSRARITREEALSLIESLNSSVSQPEQRIQLDYYYDHTRGEEI